MKRSKVSKSLRDIRLKTGASVRELAQALGYATGSGYQHLEDRFRREFLPVEKARALAGYYKERYKVNPSELLSLAGVFGEPVDDEAPRDMLVGGFVQAGVWSDNNEVPWPDRRTIPIPPEVSGKKGITALEVRGDSMDELLPPGSVIFVRDVFTHSEEGRPVLPGMIVVAQRKNDDGEFETTVKLLEHRDGAMWLAPRSKNAIHQPLPYKPLDVWHEAEPVDGSAADPLRIAGVVCGSFSSYE